MLLFVWSEENGRDFRDRVSRHLRSQAVDSTLNGGKTVVPLRIGMNRLSLGGFFAFQLNDDARDRLSG